MIKNLLTRTSLFGGLFIALLWCTAAYAQVTLPRGASPAAEVSQTIGISKVSIDYSRPSVRDRDIWGALVPYGYNNLGFGTATEAPWRAGANENTTISFSHDAMVEGKSIPAGTYGLHLGIHEDGKADVIFSKNSTSWGSYFYDKGEDQLRVTVESKEVAHTETLTYHFQDITNNSTTVMMDWEKKRVPFKVEFDVNNIVVANASNELRSQAGFNWQGPFSAANYCLNNDVELEKGLAWAEQAVANTTNFNTLNLKSQLQAKLGMNAEAKETMTAALEDPTAVAGNYYQYGRQLIGQDKDDEAMEIFTKLSKKWPENWLAPHGLARAYSAKGDYKKALKYEKEALAICPPGSKGFLEGFVAQLEKGEDFN